MTTWIAEEHVIWVLPSGERRAGRIAVGLPEMVADGEGEAKCTIALDGLEPVRAVSGQGTMQALLLALRLGGMRLYDFISHGMSVRCPNDDSEIDLSESFGAFLVKPELLVAPPSVNEAKDEG